MKSQLWHWRGVFVIAPMATLAIVALRVTGLLQGLELAALDALFRARPDRPKDDRVVIVGISEQDLQYYSHPVSDRVLAELLERIAEAEPRAIGLDIYRDLPVPPSYAKLVSIFRDRPQLLAAEDPVEPGYQHLSKVYRNTPNLLGIAKITGGVERVDPPPVLAELDRIAANDLGRDEDGKLRRAFLYLTDPETDEIVFSVGFHLAMLYLKAEGIEPELTPDDRQWVKLEETVFVPIDRYYGGYVGIDNAGYQILLDYRGGSHTFPAVEVRDVLEGRVSPEMFRDRVVLVGSTAESLKDFFDTPFSAKGQGIEKTAGVEVHANIVSQILSATLDGQAQILSWSEPKEWAWIFLAAILGAGVSWIWRYSNYFWRITGQGLVGVAFLLVGYGAFLQGWWIPVVPPLLAQTLAAIGVTAYVARSAADIRQTFSRYLTDEVVATLLETPEGLAMGGERREITILTSDLRGFTSISERLPPEQVVSILNIYLEAMADAITAYQGTIDEFMGDGILVLFGAPTQREDDPERAIACALAMQLAMDKVNQEMAKRDLPNLEMGIGINTGEVVVGNIGSLKRTKYGVVGSQVNLTYRIESYTVGGQILVTESTMRETGDIVEVEDEEKVSPKGVKEPMMVYSVVGIGGKYQLRLPEEEVVMCDLFPALAVRYTPLAGKHLSDRTLEAQLVKLSPGRVRVRSPEAMAPLTNLRFQLKVPGKSGEAEGEFYAKVVKGNGSSDREFCVRLTAVPPEVKQYFTTLYERSLTATAAEPTHSDT
ncbi:CHASE2 domain-containing protein [Baaleninema simplex]|uniref:CHASE2 domain-containing protein n=1 Tax=Baaleninema simplex TaxID=2862350 RepID=UPI000348074C|nr:adenylate/guanylate cyclase domain-containing protein [Baaleninema simplex]